jgi:hypothetical protein
MAQIDVAWRALRLFARTASSGIIANRGKLPQAPRLSQLIIAGRAFALAMKFR